MADIIVRTKHDVWYMSAMAGLGAFGWTLETIMMSCHQLPSFSGKPGSLASPSNLAVNFGKCSLWLRCQRNIEIFAKARHARVLHMSVQVVLFETQCQSFAIPIQKSGIKFRCRMRVL